MKKQSASFGLSWHVHCAAASMASNLRQDFIESTVVPFAGQPQADIDRVGNAQVRPGRCVVGIDGQGLLEQAARIAHTLCGKSLMHRPAPRHEHIDIQRLRRLCQRQSLLGPGDLGLHGSRNAADQRRLGCGKGRSIDDVR